MTSDLHALSNSSPPMPCSLNSRIANASHSRQEASGLLFILRLWTRTILVAKGMSFGFTPSPLAHYFGGDDDDVAEGSDKKTLEAQHSMQIGPFDLLPPRITCGPPALLQDLNHHDLLHDISSQLGVRYLSETTGPRPAPYTGFLWNDAATPLPMVWLPCMIRGLTRCVIFLVDTGAPSTLLCRKAFEAFAVDTVHSRARVSINGTTLSVGLSNFFADINILGADYLRLTQSVLTCDYNNLTCEIRPFAPRDSM